MRKSTFVRLLAVILLLALLNYCSTSCTRMDDVCEDVQFNTFTTPSSGGLFSLDCPITVSFSKQIEFKQGDIDVYSMYGHYSFDYKFDGQSTVYIYPKIDDLSNYVPGEELFLVYNIRSKKGEPLPINEHGDPTVNVVLYAK